MLIHVRITGLEDFVHRLEFLGTRKDYFWKLDLFLSSDEGRKNTLSGSLRSDVGYWSNSFNGTQQSRCLIFPTCRQEQFQFLKCCVF
jgi:hypothetical protein